MKGINCLVDIQCSDVFKIFELYTCSKLNAQDFWDFLTLWVGLNISLYS